MFFFLSNFVNFYKNLHFSSMTCFLKEMCLTILIVKHIINNPKYCNVIRRLGSGSGNKAPQENTNNEGPRAGQWIWDIILNQFNASDSGASDSGNENNDPKIQADILERIATQSRLVNEFIDDEPDIGKREYMEKILQFYVQTVQYQPTKEAVLAHVEALKSVIEAVSQDNSECWQTKANMRQQLNEQVESYKTQHISVRWKPS